MPRLVPSGHVFRLETGERFTVIGCVDFNLFGRYITEGEAAAAEIMRQRADYGFNTLLCWTAYWGEGPKAEEFEREIGRLVPAEHPEMYDRLRPFAVLASRFGLRVIFVGFTGGPIAGHWENLTLHLQGGDLTNVLVGLCNENDGHRGINPHDYAPIPGLLCSRGSNASEHLPPRPWWDWEEIHNVNVFEWQRKSKNGMEFSAGDAEGHITPSHVPVLETEKTRPDQDGTQQRHHDSAAAGALLIAGSFFHSPAGKHSQLFDAFHDPFVRQFIAGAESVDLTYQDGRYHHPIELEGPDDLRVYQRIMSDGRAFTVHVCT